MIYENPGTQLLPESERGSYTRNTYWDSTADAWSKFAPPSGALDRLSAVYGIAKESMPWTAIVREVDIKEAEIWGEGINPVMAEKISPQQASVEFPGIRVKLKNSKSRIELGILEARDLKVASLEATLAGKNTSKIPDMALGLAAGLGAGLTDPIALAIGITSIGLVPGIPGASQLLRLRAMAQSTAMKRGTSAAILAMDGFLGGLLFATTNAAIQKRASNRYTLGDAAAEVAVSTGFGAFLGGVFPGLAAIPQAGGIGAKVGSGKYIVDNPALTGVRLGEIKEALHEPKKKGEIWDLMDDEGSMRFHSDITDWVARVAGNKNLKKKKHLEETLERVEVTEAMIESLAKTGEKYMTPASRFRTLKGFVRSRMSGMDISRQGVYSLFDQTLENPAPLIGNPSMTPTYKTKLNPEKVRERSQNDPILSPKSVLFKIPDRADLKSIFKEQIYTAMEPQGVVAQQLIMTMNPQHTPEMLIGELFFDTELKVLDLDTANLHRLSPPQNKLGTPLAKEWNQSASKMTAKNPGEIGLSEYDSALLVEAYGKDPRFAGIAYTPSYPGARQIIQLKPETLQKAKGVGQFVLKYDARPTTKPITKENIQEVVDILNGKSNTAVPPAVNHIVEENYKAMGIEGAEGKTLFEEYVRKFNLADYKKGWRDYGAPTTILPDGRSFNNKLPIRAMPTKVQADILAVAQKVQPGDFSRWRNLDDVYNTIFDGDVEKVAAFRDGMKAKGYKYPSMLSADTPKGTWLVLEDNVVAPLGREFTGLMPTIYRGGEDATPFDDIIIDLNPKDLDVSVKFSRMGLPASKAMREFLDGRKSPIEQEGFSNTTTIGKRDITEFRQFVEHNKQKFRDMGFNRVKIRTPKGDEFIRLGKIIKGKKGGELRAAYESVEQPPKAEPETAAAVFVNERVQGQVALLDVYMKSKEHSKVNALAMELIDITRGDEYLRKAVSGMQQKYEAARNEMRTLSPHEPKYPRLQERVVSIGDALEAVYTNTKAVLDNKYEVAEGRFKVVDQLLAKYDLLEGEELLTFLKYQVGQAYQVFGGDTMDSRYATQKTKDVVAYHRTIERKHGKDILKAYVQGYFDDDLVRAKHFYGEKRMRQGGAKGKATEDGRESLEITEVAWSIYSILNEQMKISQNRVISAGVRRTPREDYIGKVSYDSRVVAKTPLAEFEEDFLANTNVSLEDISDLHKSFARKSNIPLEESITRDISDVATRPVHISFKDAESEIYIRKKYGRLKGALPEERDGVLAHLGIGTGSYIHQGMLESLDVDARLSAVASTWGTYPYLTLHSILEGIKSKHTAQGKSATSLWAAEKTATRMLDMMLYGNPTGYSWLAMAARGLRAGNIVGMLNLSALTAYFGDLGSSAATFAKLGGVDGKAPYQGFGGVLDTMRMKIPVVGLRGKNKEMAAKAFDVLTSAEEKENLSRMYHADAPGVFSYLENLALRTYLLPQVTDLGRRTNALIMSQKLGHMVGLKWDDLNTTTQTNLGSFGIDPKTWEYTRKLQGATEMHGGVPHFVIDGFEQSLSREVEAKQITRHEADNILRSYENFAHAAHSERGVPTAGIYDQARLQTFTPHSKNNPDEWWSIAGKSMREFKGTMVAAMRSLLRAGQTPRPGQRSTIFTKDMALIMAYVTALSAVAMQMRMLLLGQAPRAWDSADFWREAVTRSGVFGFYADTLLSPYGGRKGDIWGLIFGPSTGHFEQIYGAGRDIVQGDLEKIPGRVRKVGRDIRPHFTIAEKFLLNSLFLHSLGDLSGNLKSRRAVRRRLEKMGSAGYLFE